MHMHTHVHERTHTHTHTHTPQHMHTLTTYRDLVRLSHKDALNDLGEVAQVEGVVGLGRGGQQLGLDGVVGGNAGVHQLLTQRADVGTQLWSTHTTAGHHTS